MQVSYYFIAQFIIGYIFFLRYLFTAFNDCLSAIAEVFSRSVFKKSTFVIQPVLTKTNSLPHSICVVKRLVSMKHNYTNERMILCVDDDMDDLILLREALGNTHQPYRIQEAHNGKEALHYLFQAKAEGNLPCLIILDINMPILNGKETLAIIKNDEVLKALPIVVFTTSSNISDRLFCNRFGTDMVTKPIYFDELKNTVQRLLKYCDASYI